MYILPFRLLCPSSFEKGGSSLLPDLKRLHLICAVVAAAAAAAAALVLRNLLVALLPPLFPAAGGAAAVLSLPHFLNAAAGMFASPLLDIAADALSDPETVPPLTLRTICSPAWSGPYLVLLRRQSQQHASHCLFCHLSTLSYSAEVQPSDIEMGPL